MGSALPGKSRLNTTTALTKAALRLAKLADVADAIGDLTGLGATSIESLVRTAERELTNRPSAEFTAVAIADREWAEALLARTYVALAAKSGHRVMGESLIGAEAVARLANEAMTPTDRRDVDAASDDTRVYLNALSESIASLISDWYSTNEEPNRAATSQATGEILGTVRTIPNLIESVGARLDSSLARSLPQLEQSMIVGPDRSAESQPELIDFELSLGFTPLATDAELSELVSRAVVTVLEDRPVRVEVSLPTLDDDLAEIVDAIAAAQLRRRFQTRAERLRLTLSAFFSPQVEAAWAVHLQGVPSRVKVVRAILAEPDTTRAKLDVWRTVPPRTSAPVWLTPDEVHATVESTRLNHWDQLAGGAGWRAADELPQSVIVEKVMPSVLSELVRAEVTSDVRWPSEVLSLPSWHIGRG